MKNSGTIDRVLRIIIGIALISQVFYGPVGPVVWAWIGVVPLATGLIGWCPLYTLLGIKTCPSKK